MTTPVGNHREVPARVVATGLGFPEGPTMLPDGSLLVVELGRGCLTRIDLSDGRQTRVAQLGGSPNGAAIGPDGLVYVCNNGGMAFEEIGGEFRVLGIAPDYRGGSIQRVDLSDGSWETLHLEYDGRPLSGPNDIVFARDGAYWFTDQPRKYPDHRDWGAVYRATPAGEIARLIERLDDPNGIGLSPDDGTVYVAETNPGRVWAWGVEDGAVVPGYTGRLQYLNRGARLVGRTAALQYYDSMAVTAAGTLVVGTLGEPGGLTSFDPKTGAREFISYTGQSEVFVTNVCFGGRDLTKAYVTLSVTGQVLEVDWPEPGLRLPFQA